MPRHLLDEAQLHPAIRERVAASYRSVVEEVRALTAVHPVVVVGMRWNPFVRRARRALDAHGQAFHYIGFGSYLSGWRLRTALKMWTGWPTFPMVFVDGCLVGGATEIEGLISRGELSSRRSAPT